MVPKVQWKKEGLLHAASERKAYLDTQNPKLPKWKSN
jgi:hypothetical protein